MINQIKFYGSIGRFGRLPLENHTGGVELTGSILPYFNAVLLKTVSLFNPLVLDHD